MDDLVLSALQAFATSVRNKFKARAPGEPEDQLRAPFEKLLEDVGAELNVKVVMKGESNIKGTGRPDYAVLVNGILTGHVELKEPGKGAKPERFKGHDKEQWERFKALPNVLYCDGNQWGLYRSGEEAILEKLSGDITLDGAKAVSPSEAAHLKFLLHQFLRWAPIVPKTAEQLARFLAPVCRLLRDEVRESLQRDGSPLRTLAADWRKLLFPDADDHKFADAYAQTVTFALLLVRSENKTFTTTRAAVEGLQAGHTLLAKALEVLTDPQAEAEISASLPILLRLVAAVPPRLMDEKKPDPWLYFYEDFLSVYDPALRKDAGAYYTPVEVVDVQVRLVDQLLREKLGKTHGFAESSVTTLDPAVGTGTYLLGIIRHALGRVAEEEGEGAANARASNLAANLHGFENMVGPYAVSQLRVSRALQERGTYLKAGEPGIYLTDTLESPHSKVKAPALFYKPISDEHERARKIKEKVPVLVCIGNPPYDRHAAAEQGAESKKGGWVRWGEDGQGGDAILQAFTEPVSNAGKGGELKNIYNLYVYFWRWALWKVFEQGKPTGPGVVSFISASSYMDGPAFAGMRQHLRQLCDEIWILDLGGEGRGARKSENVFAIQTPVAIAVAARYGKGDKWTPAKIHFTRIEGTRQEKLSQLEKIESFKDLSWEDCPSGWMVPFRPAQTTAYFDWPEIRQIMPWQHSGCEIKRSWPIGPEQATLARRWGAFLSAPDRAIAFKETRDRKVALAYPTLGAVRGSKRLEPLLKLKHSAPMPSAVCYAFRSFDRQWLIFDNRVADYLRPELWAAHGDKQIYLATSVSEHVGNGPALTVAAQVPDRHYFSGRGGKDIIPLWRDSRSKVANITAGLLEAVNKCLSDPITAEGFAAYLYGILAHPAFTSRFAKELGTKELRVPITKDAALFAQVQALGERLLWLHTYGERFEAKGRPKGQVPKGKARCTRAISDRPEEYPEHFAYAPIDQRLTVGTGSIEPVPPEIWEFEVSGLKVVQSWLGYRMKERKGKKSSPLDDIAPERWTAEMTTELLELLWVFEATLAIYPEQARLLEAVLKGPLFTSSELPSPDGVTPAKAVGRLFGGDGGKESGRLA
jgi:hypothetical protein